LAKEILERFHWNCRIKDSWGRLLRDKKQAEITSSEVGYSSAFRFWHFIFCSVGFFPIMKN
jgi:hypothetical protein